MLAYVKKIYRHSDELLHLALILSLIRVDPESYLGLGFGNSNSIRDSFRNITMGDTWAHIPSSDFRGRLAIDVPYLHPKSMEASLAQYQEELIEDLNDLGRYYPGILPPSLEAPRTVGYLLDDSSGSLNRELSTPDGNPGSLSSVVAPSSAVLDTMQTPSTENGVLLLEQSSASDLTEEDADLIEILWKQDIDIGIPRDHFLLQDSDQFLDDDNGSLMEKPDDKDEKKKELEEKEKELGKHGDKKQNGDEEVPALEADDDPWAGLTYRIDDETGEYILLEGSEESSDSGCEADSLLPPETEEADAERKRRRAEENGPFSLDKALGFVDFDSNDFDEDKLTESNYTLGALSPESAELIGQLDPVLGSIAAPRQPGAIASSLGVSINAEEIEEESDEDLLRSTDLDLGFYFGSSSNSNSDEEDQETKEANVDSLSEQLEASLEDMIQTAQMHPRSLQVRMPLMRAMSMEHRWQDLANFLNLPDGAAAAAAAAANLSSHPGHHHHHHHHYAAAAAAGHHHMTAGHHPHHPSVHSPFAHPGYPSAHPHSPHHVHHNNATSGAYGVHPAAAAAAAAHHHHHHGYGGLAPAAATPVTAYTNPSADSGRSVLHHNASVGSPLTEIGGNGSYPSPSLGVGVTLGSAVTASMNLTNSTDSLEPAGQVAYKTESAADLHLYYQQPNANEVNQTGDGFFPSIFNEDDLQLMDMAITDTMYTPRMLDNQTVNHTGLGQNTANPAVSAIAPIDTTSDSAVSSMGSERGPSISEDWIDSNATDSNATSSVAGATAVLPSGSAYGMEYGSSGGKYRHYDYGYGRSNGMDSARGGGGAPVAQKKHQMFGKRVFHDQSDLPGSPAAVAAGSPAKFDYGGGATGGHLYPHSSASLDSASGMSPMEMKYGCGMEYNPHLHDVRGMDHVNHNHTYTLGAEGTSASQRPVARDKHSRASGSSLRGSVSDTSSTPGLGGTGTSGGSCSESEAYSRDEKRARSMNIPMTVDDIINLPMDEFNERLSKYDLTEPQLSLIRDIRRRGKNKVAAQNCRKRKLDQILTLADEVKRARERKIRLNKERDFLATEKARIKDRFAQLYRHVFQSLRDQDGQPYSPYEYSLQQSADGNILLVPRASATHGAGATIDPQPSQQQHHQHHHHQQQQQHYAAVQRSMMDPSNMAGPSSNNSVIPPGVQQQQHHGARRKTPDHKNEP